MTSIPEDPSIRYAELVRALSDAPDVTYEPSAAAKKSFGSNALKVRGEIFAMLVNGRLVVKLPARRVASLVSAGQGSQLDTGGRPHPEGVVQS